MKLPLIDAINAMEYKLLSALGWMQRHPKHLMAVVTALMVGGTGATFAVASFAPDASSVVRTITEKVTPLPLSVQDDALQTQMQRLYRSDVSQKTDTINTLFKRLGIVDAEASTFFLTDRTTQHAILGRGGRHITAETSDSNTLLKFVARWSPDEDGTFRRLTVEKTPNGLVSRIETLPLQPATRLASGTIENSLFGATDEASIPDAVTLQLVDIFSGDIDFHRTLRKGDQFSVTYETLEADGEPLRTGRVLSAEFNNGGKSFQAVWFQESPTAKGAYYNLTGDSLRRALLTSPMEFSRMSSGFKMRFHPILQTWRAHLGVDYAAPIGTPVRSVGDGIVEFAGVQSGYGNVVTVKHHNDTETVYAHLSRILVKKGARVSQAQHLGLVGRTGWATGPHLHFEFKIKGVHKDPVTVARQSESAVQAITAAQRSAFDKMAGQARLQLTAAATLRSASAE